jgi:hypothetical protein
MTRMPRPPERATEQAREYEYRVVTVPRGMTHAELSRRLTDDAEYGHWELARSRVYFGGGRRIWLRRRVIRVVATL